MVAMKASDRCLRKLIGVGVIAGSLAFALPQTTSAQACLQDEYNLVNKQKLGCTANDVQIAKVTNIRNPLTGATLNSCNPGPFNFLADFTIVTTSSRYRENVGLYIATNSTTQALTGSCVDNIISPSHPCASGQTCGSDNYHEDPASPAGDNCGDTSSNDHSPTGGAGVEVVTLEIDNFQCTAPAGSTQLVLPNCTSWQEPGGIIKCTSNSPAYMFPNTPEAIPGAPSKCSCDVIPLDITVQTPGVNVGKACNTNATTTTPSFSIVGTAPNEQLTGSPNNCSITPEGGTATYTVEIANDASNFGSVVVDQVCDSAYGQIFPAPTTPITGTCNAGSQCASPNNVTGTGCAASTTCTASEIALNGKYDCQFTANQPENKIVTNIASAIVHGKTSGTTASGSSNSVSVTSHEVDTTVTATKGVNSTTGACATVRYSVDVQNTSAAGSDETASVSALGDSAFGDLTTLHGSVLGTTCGVAAGTGTLTGMTGAGTLPATVSVGGSDYTCLFDAQICSTSGLTSGCFTHSNTLNTTLAGEGEANENVTVTETPDPLNVKVCVTTSVVP